jgi:hypothetical protein
LHTYNAIFVDRLHGEPQTTAEPPLKCYVTASCPTAAGVSVGSTKRSTPTRGHKTKHGKRKHKPHKR